MDEVTPVKPTRNRVPKTAPKPKPVSKSILAQASDVVIPSKNIVFIHGKPGVGKTATLAHAPKPLFVVDALEQGIHKLVEYGVVPKVPILPPLRKYETLLAVLEELVVEKHDYQTLVIDSITGIEQLLFRYVADTQFEGKLNKDGFYAYQAGPDTCMKYHWPDLFTKIEEVRQSGVDVYITGHSIVQVFNDPRGESYDRYEPVLHKKSWKAIDRVMDNILFMDRSVEMDKSRIRNVAKDTDRRIICCEWSPAFDAKNRMNLPPVIPMGVSGREAWDNLANAMKTKDTK